MLHNHLRNFTSHELRIDFDSTDQPHNRADRINEFGRGIEIGGYHIGGFGNPPDTIALCKGTINGSPKKRYRKKYFFLGHIEKLLRGTGMDGPDTR